MGIRDKIAETISTSDSQNEQETKDKPDYERPRVNETGVGIPGQGMFDNTEQNRELGSKQVFKRLKNSPEVQDIVRAIADDIIGSGIEMTYVGRKDNAENPGKRQVNDAEKFWKRNKEDIYNSIIDAMVMGDGYLYKKGLDEEQAINQIRSHVKSKYDWNHHKYADAAAKYLYKQAKPDTELDLEIVPASTVEHDINEFGDVERFVQEIGGNEYDLNPDKVIHHQFMSLNGGTYGFTPMQSIFSELDILANAKDYNGVRFDNAAVPNKVFKLPDDGPEGQNFEMVKETLKKYRKMPNKHKDLVLTGNIDIEDLNDAGDMEFRALAEYVTQVLIMAWGVPPSRIGGAIGLDGARESAQAAEGYNKRIKRLQDKYETVLNDEIFEPEFSIRISFQNPDIKSEIREAERDLRKTEVVQKRMSLGLMSKDEALRYLGVQQDEIPSNVDEMEIIEAARQMQSSREDQMSDTSISQTTAQEQVTQQVESGKEGNV